MARKTPPGFMVYDENAKIIEVMPDDQAGRIVKAICHFYVTGELVELDSKLEQTYLSTMADKVIRDAAKYAHKCEQNSKNANKRWHGDGQDASI